MAGIANISSPLVVRMHHGYEILFSVSEIGIGIRESLILEVITQLCEKFRRRCE